VADATGFHPNQDVFVSGDRNLLIHQFKSSAGSINLDGTHEWHKLFTLLIVISCFCVPLIIAYPGSPQVVEQGGKEGAISMNCNRLVIGEGAWWD
jgi:hypothetical protein